MKSPQEISLPKQTPINKCDSLCDQQKTTSTHSKNILKRWNSKWFLLFLFTFFSLGMQAQYSEDASINAWITEALNSDEDSSITFGSDDSDDNYGEDPFADTTTESRVHELLYSNTSFPSSNSNSIAGPYYGGVNANGVRRIYVGNVNLPYQPGSATAAFQNIYIYLLPNGEVATNYVTTVSPTGTVTYVTLKPATVVSILAPTPTASVTSGLCKGNPVRNPQIAPQRNSGINGGRFGNTRSGGKQNHNGLDIKNPYGAPVYAMFDGNVSRAGSANEKAGFIAYQTANVNGNNISVQYFHLQNNGRVTGYVHAGDIIGYQGDSGNLAAAIRQGASESHVHIKIKDSNGKPVNPENYLTTKFDSNGQPINNCN